jgi:hypothetical protein
LYRSSGNSKKGTPEYDEWFLRYRPLDAKDEINMKKSKIRKTRVKSKKRGKKSKKLFNIKLNF